MCVMATATNRDPKSAGEVRMARRCRQKVQESDVTGTKYLRKLLPLLERLHADGCARDKAGKSPPAL
jgi:hypothetical protein